MILYLDASALVKRYIAEAGSAEVACGYLASGAHGNGAHQPGRGGSRAWTRLFVLTH